MRITYCYPFAVALCLCVAANADPIGLVLSGGGSKGAYEVGVWQELQAAGVASNVTAISGTSVGALNAALFATCPDAAERLWLENMEDVFTINTNRVGESLQTIVDNASNAVDVAEKTGEDWKGLVAFGLASLLHLADEYVNQVESPKKAIGYIDSSKLATALDEVLPKIWPSSTPFVYATALEKGSSGRTKTWCLNPESPERRSLMIRASAALPVGYDSVIIDGKVYVDGGWEARGGDNVPISPIVENHPDIKTIIVVYLKDERHLSAEQRRRVRDFAQKSGVQLVEIIPSEDIGGGLGGWKGVVDFSPETARRLIAIGRHDVRKVLNNAGMVKYAGL